MADPIRSEAGGDKRPRSGAKTLGESLILLAWLLRGWKELKGRDPAPAPQTIATSTQEPQGEQPATAFEPTDWTIGPIAMLYAGVLALLVITCFVLIAAYPTAVPDVNRSKRIAPPGPRLQTDPESDLRSFRAKEEQRLNTYYWVDKQSGVVHIPIEQAMKKLATTGISGFPRAGQ